MPGPASPGLEPPRDSSPRSWGRPVPAVTVALMVLLVALIVGLHRHQNRTLFGAHGLGHGAVVVSILRSGVPPENPFAANEPYAYYWIYHLLAAAIARVLHVSPFHALEALGLVGIAGLVAAFAALGRRILGSWATGWVAAFLALFGHHPLGAMILLVRITIGEIDPGNFDPLVGDDPLRYALNLGGAEYGPNFLFFLHPTSRGPALALLPVLLLVTRDVRSRLGMAATLAVTVSLLALSPVIGLVGSLALLCGTLAAHWVSATPASERGVWKWRLAVLAAGAAIAYPTYQQMLGRLQHATSTVLPFDQVSGGILPRLVQGLPLLLLAFAGTRRADPARRYWLAVMLASGAGLLLGSLLVELPLGNEHNLYNVALLLLALPAAQVVLPAGRVSRARIAAVALSLLAFLTTPAALLWTYVRHAPAPYRVLPERLERTDLGGHDRLMAWMQEHTPPDAVLVVNLSRTEARPVQGNSSDYPVTCGRALYLGEPSYLVGDSRKFEERLRVLKRLYTATGWDSYVDGELASLGRPVFVLCMTETEEQIVRAALDFRTEVVRAEGPYSLLSCAFP